MQRRILLGGVGLAIVVALALWWGLAARKPRETPSPGPSALVPSPAQPQIGTPSQDAHLPVVIGESSGPVPTGEATATAPATEFVPPPTPTPQATPFPPGPPTKLGLFVAWYEPQIMDLIRTHNVAVLVTLELDPTFLADVRARSPKTVIVGRVVLPSIDLSAADPLVEARRAVDAVLPLAQDPRRAGLVDAWEGYNEPLPASEDEMRKLATLEVERVRLLSDQGLRAVVGDFGVGQPPLEWWQAFRPALEAARDHGGYLAVHEYSAPTMWQGTNRAELDLSAAPSDEGWLTLRYRKIYRQYLIPWDLALPLIITECGVDGGITDRPGPAGQGWKEFRDYWAQLGMGEDAPGNYVEQLAWYDAELQGDDYVVGAAVFAMTGFDGWGSYEIRGDAAQFLQQYLSVHPAP